MFKIMRKTINFQDFCDAFEKTKRREQFSYNGLRLIFNYLEKVETENGEEIELDVIAICCNFKEYANKEALQKDYINAPEEFDLFLDNLRDRVITVLTDNKIYIVEI